MAENTDGKNKKPPRVNASAARLREEKAELLAILHEYLTRSAELHDWLAARLGNYRRQRVPGKPEGGEDADAT